MSVSKGDIPVVILASGQGRRLALGDKAHVMLAGKPLLTHVIDRLPLPAAQIAINGLDDSFAPEHPYLADTEFKGDGPLCGVLTALKWAKSQGAPAVVTLSVDTPFLPRDLFARLTQQSAQLHYAAEDGTGTTGIKPHPTSALWPVNCEKAVRDALSKGDRKMMDFMDRHHAQACLFPSATPSRFFNINTKEDLATAEAYLKGDTA